MLVYIVGITTGGERLISFEEASNWAGARGYSYFEVGIDNGINVVEVLESLARELRQREPGVAKRSKRRFFKVKLT